MTPEEIDAALGTLSKTQVAAVDAYLAGVRDGEVTTIQGPDMADGARHYNAGRLAMADDIRIDWSERTMHVRSTDEG